MKFFRSTLTLSLLLNLVLLTAGGILFSRPARKPVERAVTKTVVSNETASGGVTNLPAQVLETKANTPFDWSMVESANLEVYVKNLRAIGCPEPTIRDIITPEVDEMLFKKLVGMLDPIRQGFWTILANWKTQEKEFEERMKGVERLSDERDEMLKKLVGAERDSAAEFNPNEGSQERLGFLPPEKQEQMLALTKKYNDERIRIQKEADGKQLTAEQLKTIAKMREKIDEDRKALMTAEEFEEWQLRGGNYSNFRSNPAMPDLTEDQARALAKIQMDSEQTQATLPAQSDPSYKTKMAERIDRLQQQQKAALGDERYADYKRAEDGNFQQLYQVTERYDLPRETAVKVFELQQSATKQADELREANDLSDDDRATLLSVLQAQTQRNVTQTLGENVAKTYQKHGGDWLKNLGDE